MTVSPNKLNSGTVSNDNNSNNNNNESPNEFNNNNNKSQCTYNTSHHIQQNHLGPSNPTTANGATSGGGGGGYPSLERVPTYPNYISQSFQQTQRGYSQSDSYCPYSPPTNGRQSFYQGSSSHLHPHSTNDYGSCAVDAHTPTPLSPGWNGYGQSI